MTNLVEQLEQLKNAVSIWESPLTYGEILRGINQHWRDWQSSSNTRLTVLRVARSCIRLEPQASQVLQQALKEHDIALDKLPWEGSVFEPNFGLAHAILKTALAATTAVTHNFSFESEKKVARLLDEAASQFDKHWPISSEKFSFGEKIEWGKYKSEREQVRCLLHAGIAGGHRPLISTYLAMHRLLWFILYGNHRSDYKNEFLMPFVRSDSADPQLWVGECLPFRIRPFNWGINGCYLDPLSVGAIALDKKFCEAIRNAWRLARSFLKSKSSLQIELPVGELPGPALQDSSGGGLLAVALRLTSEQKPIASYKSATGTLEIPDSEINNSNDEPLDWAGVSIGAIGSTLPKVRDIFKSTYIQKVALVKKNFQEWKETGEKPSAKEVKHLTDLYKFMSANGSCDILLEKYRDHLVRQWKTPLSGRREITTGFVSQAGSADARDASHQLNNYVPQRVRIEIHPTVAAENSGVPNRRLPKALEIPFQPELGRDTILKKLLALSLNFQTGAIEFNLKGGTFELAPGKDLLIYDRAGSGKSVMTLRIAHLLSSERDQQEIIGHKMPLLVVRIEGRWTTRNESWVSLQQMLVDHVMHALKCRESTRWEVVDMVEHAIIWQRVVVIVDGFDQFSPLGREHIVAQMRSPDGCRCRWIIASRQHTIDELFPYGASDRWLRVRLVPFDYNEQNQYFEKAGVQDWSARVDVSAMNQLLGSPMVLRRIADLLATPGSGGDAVTLQRKLYIESDSQLGLVTMRRSLDDALRTAPVADLVQWTERSPAFHVDLLDQVLSTIAFQCMLEKRYDASVPQVEIADLNQQCLRRYLMETNREIVARQAVLANCDPQSKHLIDGDLFLLDKKRERLFEEWNKAVELLCRIELNHRDWVEHANHHGFAFQSRKAMELYAARYLTRYATQEDVFGAPHAPGGFPSALDYISDPDWLETWRLAIEMPRVPLTSGEIDRNGVADESTMCLALSALFHLPKQGLRPTELIYRCWHLFEWDPEVFRERRVRDGNMPSTIAGSFRNEPRFESLGRGMLLGATNSMVREEAKSVIQLFRSERESPAVSTECSSAIDHAHGATASAAVVTLGMYGQFDPRFPQESMTIRSRDCPRRTECIGGLLKDDRQAVVGVTWFDAYVYCKWRGEHFRLPFVSEICEERIEDLEEQVRQAEWCLPNEIRERDVLDRGPIEFLDKSGSSTLGLAKKFAYRGLRDATIGFRLARDRARLPQATTPRN